MSNRSARAQIAQETVAILDRGAYVSPSGRTVPIAEPLERAKAGTILYRPHTFEEFRDETERRLAARRPASQAHVDVTNETTFAAAARLLQEDADRTVAALNFASAKNPGGGFLNGSQAQEESLARASGLYACLLTQPDYYDKNRTCGTPLYTDHIIYSPAVPVFRDDRDRLLEEPYFVSIMTAPAVNAGAVMKNEPRNIGKIEQTMLGRIEKILTVALLNEQTTLILGAWGCGVFRNEPAQVARWFGRFLLDEHKFANAFDRIVFAVLDHSADRRFLGPFEQVFANSE